ncbi:ATP-binding cassette domain-containing protein [Staphylococcus edaphicus]|uniref:ABC transporter ATP-binding protein n=1 Tax=Staphylococcus edaphicus TaxID=1955013 RepID=A0A2C6WNP7_9STAP|nr:ABC transporter ATP-binding protein [Staphylococcus edaphicus]PHK49386.1 ABC transporter ATP-binding protein [Staphylococcus edaphicus]UQW80452.1 ABC transporter ATP-binding protein [Staphylococcus edaphicus]
MSIAVNVKNVSLKINNKAIVDNLSVEIPKNSITLISGANGIGKSITLKLIAKLIHPSKGNIQVNGRICYAPDKFPDNLNIKVHTFLETIQNLNKDNGLNWKYYSKLFNLTSFEKDKLNQLSKGILQKINIIQALLKNGDILIFDEPFSGLDKLAINRFIILLKDLSKSKTIILTSHENDSFQSFITHEVNLQNGNFTNNHTKPLLKSITVLRTETTPNTFPTTVEQKVYNKNIINNNSIKLYIARSDTNNILSDLIKHNFKILEVKDE